jgi:hypothetical protein
LDSAGGCFGSEEYSGSGSDDGPALDLDWNGSAAGDGGCDDEPSFHDCRSLW